MTERELTAVHDYQKVNFVIVPIKCCCYHRLGYTSTINNADGESKRSKSYFSSLFVQGGWERERRFKPANHFYFSLSQSLTLFAHFSLFVFLLRLGVYLSHSLTLSLFSRLFYTDRFSFIHRCRFIECLASWAYIGIHSRLTNRGEEEEEKRKREGSRAQRFHLRAFWMVGARRRLPSLFFLRLLSFSLSRRWLDTDESKMQADATLHSPS